MELVSHSLFVSYAGNYPFNYVFVKLLAKMERNFCQKLFKVIKKEFPPWIFFITLRLSRSVGLCRKWFSGERKGRKTTLLQETKQIRYFNILNMINILTLLSADAKSAILLRVPSLTKFEWHNFLMLNFPRWFCLVNGQLSVSLRRVKRSAICKFLCFCLFNIQQWSVSS